MNGEIKNSLLPVELFAAEPESKGSGNFARPEARLSGFDLARFGDFVDLVYCHNCNPTESRAVSGCSAWGRRPVVTGFAGCWCLALCWSN